MTAGDSINHAFDGGHLSASFHGVAGVVISPPVPASERIALGKTSPHSHGVGLRIENDDFVRVGPRIISSPLYIGVAYLTPRAAGKAPTGKLFAAVEDDVHSAQSSARARGRHIGPARPPHTMGLW